MKNISRRFTSIVLGLGLVVAGAGAAEAATWTYKYAGPGYTEATCEALYYSPWGKNGVNLVYVGNPYYVGSGSTLKCAVRVG